MEGEKERKSKKFSLDLSQQYTGNHPYNTPISIELAVTVFVSISITDLTCNE